MDAASGLCDLSRTPPTISRAGLFASRTAPSGLSVSKHRTAPPDRFVTCPVSVEGFPRIAGPGFACGPPAFAGAGSGSPDGTAETSSSSYGLPVRLALLSTPPHDGAVTVGYRTETGTPEGDFHLSDVIRLRTHDPRDQHGDDGLRVRG